MNLLIKAIDRLSATHYGFVVLNYIQHLDAFEIKIIIAAVALLFALLVYRRFGASIFWGLLFVYFLSYIIYTSNLFGYYNDSNQEYDQRMQAVQEEIEKK